MTLKSLACITLLCAMVVQSSLAAPILTVEELGPTPAGDRLWIAQISPDPALLPSSLAVELAFAIDDAELIGVDVQSAIWDHENPGFNPFTGTITDGLWVDLIGDRTFGAFGSIVLNSSAPVDLFLFETSGLSPTTIRYGMAATGLGPGYGSIIAQAGQQWEDYTGSVTAVPEPTTMAMAALALVAPLRRRKRAA